MLVHQLLVLCPYTSVQREIIIIIFIIITIIIVIIIIIIDRGKQNVHPAIQNWFELSEMSIERIVRYF